MKKTIIEVIKANKTEIVKKALIVGGTAVGLAIVATVLKPKTDEEDSADVEMLDEQETVDSEESTEE